MNILDKVRKTIKQHNLFQRGDNVLIALSGGSDSVCLFDILNKLRNELGISISAAHVNHGLREEAGRDEELVIKICKKAGVECYVSRVNAAEEAARRKMSVELAGRTLRYEFFESLAAEYNLNKLATAHHRNDSAESILLHLIRGCASDGLRGISYCRGSLVRPLLDISKIEIEQYISEHGLEFAVDSTNFETEYTRNKIRLKIMPEIVKINHGFADTVCNNGKIIADEADFVRQMSKRAYDDCVINGKVELNKFNTLHKAIKRRVIAMLYMEFSGAEQNPQEKYIDAVVQLAENGETGKRVNLNGGIMAVTEYGELFFCLREVKSGFCTDILGEGVYSAGGVEISVRSCRESDKSTVDKLVINIPESARVQLRSRRSGDYFYPTGMSGRKKLSDYFVDLKIPAVQRNSIPILTIDDEIAWVVGYRADRRFIQKYNNCNYVIEISSKV